MTRYITFAEYLVITELATGFAAEELDLNDGRWAPDPPDVDEAEQAMVAVAAGEIDEAAFAGWLRARVEFEEHP